MLRFLQKQEKTGFSGQALSFAIGLMGGLGSGNSVGFVRPGIWALALLLVCVPASGLPLPWGAMGASGIAMAQLTDESEVSTEGTQFIPRKKPPEEPPPQADKPQAVVPAPKPPIKPKVTPPPPRFPSVVILLDTSDSMLNPLKQSGKTRLDEAKGALVQVLEGMSPETQVQVWTFNTNLRPVLVNDIKPGSFVPIGVRDNRRAFIEQIYRIGTAGGTNLYQSVAKAFSLFANPRDQAQYRAGLRYPALVVISDGEDGGKTREDLAWVRQTKARFPMVAVSAIGFRISRGEPWFGILCEIASRKDGCSTANDGAQLRHLLESFYKPPKR